MKSWPALLILIGGVLAAWGSWVSSNKNDQQQETIQKTGEENTTLGKNNEQLSTPYLAQGYLIWRRAVWLWRLTLSSAYLLLISESFEVSID